jgi:hypothetical protein
MRNKLLTHNTHSFLIFNLKYPKVTMACVLVDELGNVRLFSTVTRFIIVSMYILLSYRYGMPPFFVLLTLFAELPNI